MLPDARRALKGKVSVLLRQQAPSAKAERPRRGSKAPVKTSVKDLAKAGALKRLNCLKAWRCEVAREHTLPAFVIFHDATLRAIAEQAPLTMRGLEGISGMGVKKLQAYDAEVLWICAGLA